MARRIITEADIEQWVKRAGVTEVVLYDNDVVTALARDLACDLGLRFVETVRDRPAAAGEPIAMLPLVDVGRMAQIVSTVLARYGAGEKDTVKEL